MKDKVQPSYRSIGGFYNGIPMNPKRKRKMKLSLLNAIKVGDIELELENLKKKIQEEEGPSNPIIS